MLRVSIHSSLPSEASRFNRTDWLDIGYQSLKSHAEYKIVLFEAGIGAREPVCLRAYPRWSSSLWDLVARAIALSYWHAPYAGDTVYATVQPGATDADGNAVELVDIQPTPIGRRPPKAVYANELKMPAADDVGTRCAFAATTTAVISHYPSNGVGGRRLGTLLIAHDKKTRGLYGAHVTEDPLSKQFIPTFFYSPAYLSPAELVCRTACHILGGSIDALPECPALQVPLTHVVDGVEHIKIHHLDEPARTGFLRWLLKQNSAPKATKDASLGRIPLSIYLKFLETAI